MKSVSGIKAMLIIACTMIFCGVSAQNQKGLGIFEGYSDIGGVKLKGKAAYDASTDTYTMSGGGINVWGELDQHAYLWKKVKGNFSLTAKVSFEGTGVNAHRKVGIMLRDALTGESRCVHLDLHGDGLTSLQYREKAGGITAEIKGPPNGNYITLEKVGKKIRMRTATDVFPEAVTAEYEIDFPGTFYVGLFTCSHEADVLETGYFTNVVYKKLK